MFRKVVVVLLPWISNESEKKGTEINLNAIFKSIYSTIHVWCPLMCLIAILIYALMHKTESASIIYKSSTKANALTKATCRSSSPHFTKPTIQLLLLLYIFSERPPTTLWFPIHPISPSPLPPPIASRRFRNQN